MQILYDYKETFYPKKCDLRSLSGFFYMGSTITKTHRVQFKTIKQSFIKALLDIKKKRISRKIRKKDKFYIKSKLKFAFFWSHTICIEVVF